ncbi:MAG: diacylglycerol kinase family lipid kinase [Alphaproteobacteria bacterium]|nr:diacylglycerol kinase family lipid kinase [Alphaproteobacteria bacterium]
MAVVFNPAAGQGEAKRRFECVVELLQRDATVDLFATANPGDAERAAREACATGVDAVVAAGGDGTANEVLNGIAGCDIPLGLIPCGTANVLAAELNLPRDPIGLAGLLARGPVRTIWVGLADSRRFALMASAGLDADIVRDVNPRLKRMIGKAAYAWAFLESILTYTPSKLVVRVGDRERRASQVLVAKAARYGGNFVAVPEAGLEQPEFIVYAVTAPGRSSMLALACALVRGNLSTHPMVEKLRGREVWLECEGEAVLQADGELVGALPARIAIDPRQARVIAPALPNVFRTK